jgi:DNA-binding transcriptional ArsR family regulator
MKEVGMLEPVLGSLVREQVLQFLHDRGEGYAREISRHFDASLDSVQKQLKRLERGSVLKCERKGRTLIYRFNKDDPFLNELCRLLDRVSCSNSPGIEDNTIQKRCIVRKRRMRNRVRVIVKKYGEGR